MKKNVDEFVIEPKLDDQGLPMNDIERVLIVLLQILAALRGEVVQ